MINFKDYSTYVTGTRNHKEIPYNKFDAKRSEMGGFSRFLVITGLFVATIGIASIVLAHPGTTAFYIGSAEALFGVAIVIGTARKHHQNSSHLQKLPLPEAKTAEKYVGLLDLNAGNHYGFDIPDLFKSNKQNIDPGIKEDIIYLKNGKPIPLDSRFNEKVLGITNSHELTTQIVEIANREPDPHLFHKAISHLVNPKTAYKIASAYYFIRGLVIPEYLTDEVEPHVNEALFEKMSGILRGRYSNENLLIEVEKRNFDKKNPSASTQVDVVGVDGKWHIHARQLFQITFINKEHSPVYLAAELKVDVEKGLGRLTWQSPQTNIPLIKT